jgi:hypothetical protein
MQLFCSINTILMQCLKCKFYVYLPQKLGKVGLLCLMPLSTIFQLIILWQSVLLVEETGVPGENHQPATIYGRFI